MKDTFQNWKICECIGSGAFGKVYRITRTEFGHTYEAALKVLEIPQHPSDIDTIRHEGMCEKEITEYFESVVEDIVKEFTLMSKLKGNSHIVSYEDHDVVRKEAPFGWEIYIRMELLTPLYTYIEQHPMTVPDVIKMGIHLCKALELCERHHIIHRDIKPENIFVSNNGDFKLGDFGIARELEKTSGDLSKKGTKSYMAPEIYKGMEYNFSVDIYSLGIVLYRFLNNNRLPFYPNAPKPIRYSDKEEATLLRMCGNEMPKPCNASGQLADIILKACAYISSKRYGSAEEMREDLERVYQNEFVMTEKEKQSKFVLGSGENSEQHSVREQEIREIAGEETQCLSNFQSLENTVNEERTVAMFAEWEKTNHFLDNNSQEDTVLLEHEKAEEGIIKGKDYIVENDTGVKKHRKLCAGVAISCVLVALIVCVIGEKNKYVQVGMLVEQKENLLSNIVSDLFVIENINFVPNTLGMKWKEAETALTRLGLHVEVEEKYNVSVKKGIVIRQSLKAGVRVQEGEQVTLVVSKGEKPKSTVRPTQKPTEKPTAIPTVQPTKRPTQEGSTVSQGDDGGRKENERPASRPHKNNDSNNEVQEWNPNE